MIEPEKAPELAENTPTQLLYETIVKHGEIHLHEDPAFNFVSVKPDDASDTTYYFSEQMIEGLLLSGEQGIRLIFHKEVDPLTVKLKMLYIEMQAKRFNAELEKY